MALSKRGKLTLKVVLVVLAVAAVVGVATYFIVSSLASYKKVTLQYGDGRTVIYSVREDGKFGIPADNTREGYAFENWYVDQGCTVPYNFDSSVSDDITIYAKWTPVNAINFYLNDGTNDIFKTYTNQDYEKPFAVPSEEPTREKYNFLGWSTTPELGTSNVLYKYGTTSRAFEIPLNGISLYAVWSRDEVTIKYDFGIGSLNGKKSEVVVLDRNQEHFIKDITPECKGYTFIGWSPDSDYVAGESLLYQSADLPTEDGSNPVNPKLIATQSTVLYAVYRQHTITLRFFSNTFDTVTGTVPDVIASYNQPILIPNIVFERDGYGLYAWSTKPNYEIGTDTGLVYVPGEDWFTFGDSYSDGEVVELYAIWVVREINLVFDFGQGVGTLNGIPYTSKEYTAKAQYNTEFTVPAFTVKYNIDDAFFVGFAAELTPDPITGAPRRSEIFYAGDAIWLRGDMVLVGADGTLTVVIEAFYSNSVTYEVTFELNGGVTSGGVNRIPAQYVVYPPSEGETTLINLQQVTKKGYDFVGWTTVNGKEGTKVEDADIYTEGIQYNVNRNIKLYAYFVPYKYNIEYHGNGETNGFTIDKATYSYDESIPLLRCGFEKEGYNFVGWATTPTGAAKYTEGGTFSYLLREGDNPEFILGLYPSGSTLHFYAVWEIKTYTVSLSEGEGYILSAAPGNSTTVKYGENFTFVFEFVTGYDKAGANIYVNGSLVTLSDWKYTVRNIKGNVSVTVEGVKINTFTVTLPESDKFVAEAYGTSVDVTDIGYGHSYQFRIRLEEPYTQSEIVVKTQGTDGTIKTLTPTNGVYTITNIIFDQTVMVENIQKNTYTITLVSGTGYTLEAFEGASTIVEHGKSFTFMFVLDERYNLSPFVLYVNGSDVVSYEQVTGEALSYLGFLEDVRNDKTITVTGVTINTYTVSLAVGVGYTMSPVAGSSTPCDHGTSFTFKFALDVAYSESPFNIFVNGEKVTLNADKEYTITNITKNIVVTVTGIEKNRYDVIMPTFDKQVGYNLTAEGSTNVEYGSNLVISFGLEVEYTKSNYQIKINGTPITLDENGKYEIQNITEQKTIEVSGVTMNTYTISYLPSMSWAGYTFDFWGGNTNPVLYGGSFVFSFSVNVGYDDKTAKVYIIEYGEDGVEVARTDVYQQIKANSGQYTITNITTDIELFVDGIQVVMWDIIFLDGATPPGYTVNPLDGYENERPSGKDYKFVIDLKEAYSYSIPVVFVNNIQIIPVDENCTIGGEEAVRSVYTIPNIVEDQYIKIEGIEINKYQVLITNGVGYSINPVSGYETTVEHGNSFKFTVTLDEAYQASSSTLKVMVNGERINHTSGVYTISNITAGQIIAIEGIAVNKYNVTFPDSTTLEKYFETFNTAQGMEVEWGGSFTFTVKLKAEYSQSDLVVTANGTEVPHAGTTYVITSVKSNQIIAVSGMTTNEYQIALPSGNGFVSGYYGTTESTVKHGEKAEFYYYILPAYSDSTPIIRLNGTVINPVDGGNIDLNLTITPSTWEVEIASEMQTCHGYIFTVEPVEKRYQMTIAGVNNNVYLINFEEGEGFVYVDDKGAGLTFFEAAQDNVTGGGADSIRFKVNLDTRYDKSVLTVTSINEKTLTETVLELVDGFYEMIDIRSHYLIKVTGVTINTYEITLPASPVGYTIVPRANSTNPVEFGQSYGFTIELKAAYTKSAVKVYTENAAGTKKEIVVASGIYILRNVTEEFTIIVEGVEMNTYQIKIPSLGEQIGYTLRTTGGYSTTVIYDDSYGFEFELLYGYTQSNFTISINGVGISKADLINGKFYTIGNITDDQIITVKNVQLNTYVMDIPTGEGYTIGIYNGVSNVVTHGNDFNFILTLGEAYKESKKNVHIYYQPTDESRPKEEVVEVTGYYTIEGVVEPLTITIEGVAISIFDITFPTTGVGYIIKAFNNQPMQVEYNKDFVFTVSLEEAYSDSPVMVKANGVFLSPESAGSSLYKISGIKAHQTITVENVVVNTYRINLITGTGYNYTPITEGFIVEFGNSYEFNVTLLEGYTKSAYTVRYRTTGQEDDQSLEITGSRYLLSNIKSNKDIYVINVTLNTYAVTYPQDLEQGYTITPVQGFTTTVYHGSTFQFTIELDDKHDRSNFTITANDVEISAAAGTYIISNVKEDQVIKVLNITVNTYTITFPTRQVGYKVEAVTGFASPVIYGGIYQLQFTLEEAYSDSVAVMIIKINGDPISLTNWKYQISDIKEDKEITVSGVTKNLYNITLATGEGYNLIPQSGSESPVEWGGSFAFKFTLKEEYDQSNYDVLINGVSVKSQLVAGGYTIANIKAHQNITVTDVTRNIYTITFPTVTTGYELLSITNTNNKITHGEDFAFKVTLLPPYSESQISVKANGVSLFEAGGRFTIKNVTQHQTIEITGVTKNLYTVTLRTGEGYKLVAKAGSTSPVEYDDNFTFKFSLNEGYTDSNYIIYLDGEPINLNADLEFEIQYIRADVEVTVEGVEMNKYTITLPTVQTGYSIGPATGSSSPVLYNKEYTFTLSLSNAYNQSTPVVKVNGEQVILSDGQYTIKNIKEDKVITVEEVKLNTYRVILPDEADQIGYTLAFKAGGTGTVDYGSSCGFTFELDEAYDRSSYTVRVNGTPVGIANNEYTIQNIRADQVITVENVKMNEYTISIPNYQTGYTLKAYTGSSSPVYHGGNFTLQFILLEGYDQSLSTFKLKLDGAEIQTALSPDGLYTISNVTNDHVLTVEGIKINTYSIIYRYYMGATELTKQLEVNHGADVPLGDIPNADGRTGYNFLGWSSESTNITSSKTITASYIIKTYVITWSAENADYGSNTWEYAANYQTSNQKKATSVVTYNSMYGYFEGRLDDALIQPSRLGYEFKGWYTQNVGGTQITRNTGVADLPSNTTYYAQWIATAIIVELDKNGGEGNPPVINSVYNQGDTIALEQGGMSRSRYTFAGWSLDRLATRGDTEYKVNISHARLENEVYTITLYAIWTRDTVTITFDANGGANPPEPTKVYTYESLTLTDAYMATRTGLTFYGWCANPNGNGTIYSKDFGVELIPVENTNVYLYAIWAYEITYNKNFPGEDDVTKKYSIINKDYQLETVYSVNYYTFVGWSLTADGEVEYPDKFIFEPLESDLNLYGVWIAGYGTQSVPFKIGTIKDWNNVVGFYAPEDTIYYQQVNHIEETAAGQLLRIEEFAGNYDGNNKTIKMYSGCAPFDIVTATAKITNFEVVANNFYYSTYSYFGGICLRLYGKLENCKFTNNTTLTVTSALYCGGLAAMAYSGSTITNCSNTANITVNGKNETYLGGLVGYADSGVTITNSSNTGAFTTTSTSGTAHHVYIGGAVGYVNTTAVVSVELFTNSGAITSTNCVSDIGGAIGYVYNAATVTVKNTTNTGAIATTAATAHNIGGIVGGAGTGVTATLTDSSNTAKMYAYSSSGSYYVRVAGIFGFLDNNSILTVTKCFNKGEIASSGAHYTLAGGIFAENEGTTTITECYNTANVYRIDGKTGSYGFIGGLFGRIYNSSKVEKSFNIGNVTYTWSSGSNYIGGIGGYSGNTFTLTDSYNIGVVTGVNTYTGATELTVNTGGLVGYFNTGTIKNCYNGGYVNSIGTTGARAGGLLGYSSTVDITNSYNYADVCAEITRSTENATGTKACVVTSAGIIGHSSTKTTLSYVYNAGAVRYKVANLTFQNIYTGGLIGNYASNNPTGTNIGWANDVSGDVRTAVRSDNNSTVLNGTGMSQKSIMDTIKNSSNALYSTWATTNWNFDSSTNNGLPTLKIANDVSYSITVTFNSNYGTATTTTSKVPSGKTAIMAAYPFTRDGYTIIGWASTASATTPEYEINECTSFTASTTLYAVWAKGNGTSANPYEISSNDLWNRFVYNKALIAGTYYKQTTNLSGTLTHNSSILQPWDFYGVYDGGSYSITLSDGSFALFKTIKTGATVKNVNLVHSSSLGYYPYYSMINGYGHYHVRKGGFASELNGTIDNCTWNVSNLGALTYTSGTYYVGMTATANNATITNSTVIFGSNVKPNTYNVLLGGFVGTASGTLTITNCTAKGIIEASSVRESASVGGIVGSSSATLNITGSKSLIDISLPVTTVARAGGLVGHVSGGSTTISNSYNSGSVITSSSTSTPYSGGLVGLAEASLSISNSFNIAYLDAACTTSSPYAGGLVGCSKAALTILNSYNSGSVSSSATSGTTYSGGLVGTTVGYTMRDSFSIGRIMATSNGVVYAAGIVASQNITSNTTMSNVYAGGSVTSNSSDRRLGGVLGNRAGSATFTVTNTYWSSIIWSNSSSLSFSYNGSQSGASQMSYSTLYANLKNTSSAFYTTNVTNAWDFTNTWKTNAAYNSGLPYLKITDEANSFDITVTHIDGSRGNSNVTNKIGYGSTYITVDTVFTASGYTFAGWSTSNGGSPSYLNYYVVTNITSNTNLYAVWYKGDGTSSHPYEITDYTTWRKFVVGYGATEGVYYKQVSDLTSNGNGTTMTPISEFRGVYDGNGRKFTLVESANPFNNVYGTIKNLNVYNNSATIYSNSGRYIAGLVTTLAGSGRVENCTMNGSISVNYTGTDVSYVGGLVARVVGTSTNIVNSRNYATITANGNSPKIVGGILAGFDTAAASGTTLNACINFANISVTTSSYYSFVGGLVGGSDQTNNTAKTATFTNCYNIGTINTTSTGVQGVGGLIGRLQDTKHNAAVSVTSSYNAAFINTSTTKNTHLGGLIGYTDKATVANSFNVGKLYGYVDSSVAINIGGLVGFAYNNKEANKITITKSYNVGLVNYSTNAMQDFAGGLVGGLNKGTQYYDIGTTNYYVNNVGNARNKAVGAEDANITTGNANFDTLISKLRNFSSDPIYSGVWSTSTWKTSELYNNGLPYFASHGNDMFTITVSFANNYSTGSMTSRYLYSNSMFITPECTGFNPTDSDATFLGWTTVEEGMDMEYSATALVKGLTENMTLYPVFGYE